MKTLNRKERKGDSAKFAKNFELGPLPAYGAATDFEFLCGLCGISSANLAVNGSFSRRRVKTLNRKERKGNSAKFAKNFDAKDFSLDNCLFVAEGFDGV